MSEKKYDENVLAIPLSVFKERYFEGFVPAVGRDDLGFYLGSPDGETPSPAVFLDRNIAENDPTYKQIIPYFILLQGESVFVFDRSSDGKEDRLHHKSSIGIGGHINDKDDSEPFWAYLKGGMRELLEEVGLNLNHDAAKNSVNPARKCQVQISPCGRIGLSQCETGALSASAAIRIPVNRLTTKATAVTQCRKIVPTSLRGGWLCRSIAAEVGFVFVLEGLWLLVVRSSRP